MGRALPSLLCAAAAGLAAGCGPAGPPPGVAVSGAVTVRGRPLAEGTVHFHATGPGATLVRGAAVQDGRYALAAADGLPPGAYRVEVTNLPPGPLAGPAPPPLPDKYNARSKLSATVEPGKPCVFNFHLD